MDVNQHFTSGTTIAQLLPSAHTYTCIYIHMHDLHVTTTHLYDLPLYQCHIVTSEPQRMATVRLSIYCMYMYVNTWGAMCNAASNADISLPFLKVMVYSICYLVFMRDFFSAQQKLQIHSRQLMNYKYMMKSLRNIFREP